MGVVAGAYYALARPGDTLLFLNPLATLRKMSHPIDAPESYSIPLRTGRLILFPNWMTHYTESNPEGGVKVTLGFNLVAPDLRRTGILLENDVEAEHIQ